MIKAVLIDFDGTTVTKDILDILCGLNGKQAESNKLNTLFYQGKLNGVSGLVQRINLLKGISLSQIANKLSENTFLMPGAEVLFTYLKENNIISILHSGNIVPVLKFYQQKLGVDYIVGSNPSIENNTIQGISEDNFPEGSFKLLGIQKILADINLSAAECVAIGDSPADIPIFEYAKYSISINPKNGVEKHTDFSIQNNLSCAIKIIKEIQEEL